MLVGHNKTSCEGLSPAIDANPQSADMSTGQTLASQQVLSHLHSINELLNVPEFITITFCKTLKSILGSPSKNNIYG